MNNLLPHRLVGCIMAGILCWTTMGVAAGADEPAPVGLGETVAGQLTANHPREPDGSPYQAHTFHGTAGQRVVIAAESDAFDTYLLLRLQNHTLTIDDDSGGGTNARIAYQLPADGAYTILVNAYGAEERGEYRLTVRPPTENELRTLFAEIALGQQAAETLKEEDPRMSDESAYHLYTFAGKQGQAVTILAESGGFDTYLFLRHRNQTLMRDDDSGGETNARIVATLPADDMYTIMVNAYKPGEFGDYALTLREPTPAELRALPIPIKLNEPARDELRPTDRTFEDGSNYREYQFTGTAHQRVAIVAESEAFDTYLVLRHGDSKLAEDDDSAGGTNSRIVTQLPENGTYSILVNAYEPGALGEYVLSIREPTLAELRELPVALKLGEPVRDDLRPTDRDLGDGSNYREYEFTGSAGQYVAIVAESDAFDTFISLSHGESQIAVDDDSGGETNSRILTELPDDGVYRLIINSYHAEGQGDYTLLLRDPTREEIFELQEEQRTELEQVVRRQGQDYALSLGELASHHHLLGDVRRAEPLSRQAVEISRLHLEHAALVQSEREQLDLQQQHQIRMDQYVTLAMQMDRAPEEILDQVLDWKGSVTTRQTQMRQLRRRLEQSDDHKTVELIEQLKDTTREIETLAEQPAAQPADDEEKTAEIFAKLESASRELATRSRQRGADAASPEHELRLLELTERIEQLQRQLAAQSAEYREQLRRNRVGPAQLAEAMPPGTAMVVFLEYRDGQTEGRNLVWSPRMLAFVLRDHETRAQVVDLGLSSEIEELITLWSADEALVTSNASDDAQQLAALRERWTQAGVTSAGRALRQRIWEPLVDHLDNAPLVLVSLDGPLSMLALPALPGATAGTYLIEEVAIATVALPNLLPDMLEADGPPLREPVLLVVGDVDYGAAPGQPVEQAIAQTATRSAQTQWPPLTGSRAELLSVADSFRSNLDDAVVHELRRSRATEQAVRERAADARWIHFATHGFFYTGPNADQQHPGLLSGLVLAGANLPVEPGSDDGVLTALEVAELDLAGVELIILSACETGLGVGARGEGLLGLQRACQLAGARTVVAAMWAVPDDVTAMLMVRFYENLHVRQMGKLDALREAQIWMLNGAGRGVALEDQPPVRLPAKAWGAFVLSGDWR